MEEKFKKIKIKIFDVKMTCGILALLLHILTISLIGNENGINACVPTTDEGKLFQCCKV